MQFIWHYTYIYWHTWKMCHFFGPSYMTENLENLLIKELWKSIYICRSYDQNSNIVLFREHSVTSMTEWIGCHVIPFQMVGPVIIWRSTRNATKVNDGQRKLKGVKMQERTIRDMSAVHDNARHDSVGQATLHIFWSMAINS